jgi:hypothetical protein
VIGCKTLRSQWHYWLRLARRTRADLAAEVASQLRIAIHLPSGNQKRF